MKKYVKWGMAILFLVVVISFAAFYAWATTTYGPSEELQELVDLESVVTNDAVVFEPEEEEQNAVGVILYPGAKVENTAYAYYAHGLMEAGYTVIVPEMVFNFALLSSGKASEYVERYPEIEHWIVGGHSLGGVAAAMYAAEHEVAGVLFLGSYPSESADLSEEALPVLSIYAENDGLTVVEDIETTKPLLPKNTVYAEIKGGNHAQFGMYGEQKGDLQANISVLEQQEQMIELTLKWLEENGL